MRCGSSSAIPCCHGAVSYSDLSHTLNNQLPSRGEALRAYEADTGLVGFLRELIERDLLSELDLLADAIPLGYNETKGMYGIPFDTVMLLMPRY